VIFHLCHIDFYIIFYIFHKLPHVFSQVLYRSLFAGPMAQWRARSQVLVFGLIWLISPYPPSGHLGSKSVRVNAWHGALGRPFFDHFLGSILDSILDSSWVRFGLVLGTSKIHLEAVFVQKSQCSKNIGKRKGGLGLSWNDLGGP